MVLGERTHEPTGVKVRLHEKKGNYPAIKNESEKTKRRKKISEESCK